MKLRDYQDRAVTHIFERDRSLILAAVGAGKTAIALTAMREFLRGGYVKRWLVLAPLRVAKSVWPSEAQKWAPDASIAVAVGSPNDRLAVLRGDAEIVVINYDNLQWLAEQELNFDAVVFDELTRLKNPSGARFKALHRVINPMQIRIGLTGSFTSNGLEDVFGQCKIVDQTLLGRTKGAFQQQYFYLENPYTHTWAPRPGALEQVMERIKPATFVLEPGEYKDKLPPLHTVVVPCEMPLRVQYENMKRDFIVQFPDAEAVAANAAAVVQKLAQLAAGCIYTPEQTLWLSDHKLDLVEEIYHENQQAPTIVVYNYKAELKALKLRFKFAATLDDDDDVIERWNAGKVRMLLIHPQSAAHGLNLQAGGCRMIWTTLPWSLELYEQAIGRLHRSGQRHDVWNYILQARETIDEAIWAALRDKRNLSDLALEALK